MTSNTNDQASSNNHNHANPIHQSHKDTKPQGKVLGALYQQKSQPVSQEIEKEAVRAFGDDTYVNTVQGQKNTWTNLFSTQKWTQCKQIWKQYHSQWRNIDTQWADSITKFKEENILTLGDIRIRSVLMAFSSAVLYKSISWNTVGLLRKSRNMGISFVLTGYWFVPELFNPFLKKSKLAESL